MDQQICSCDKKEASESSQYRVSRLNNGKMMIID